MPSTGDGTGWDETLPTDSDNVSDGPLEIRDLRKGSRIRLEKEHGDFLTGSAGGEHLNGSAKAYYGTILPTTRPDGVTSLNSSDAGRLWIDPVTGIAKWWHQTQLAWHTVNASLAAFPYARYSDRKASGTNGGTFTLGAWRTRVLNTVEYDPASIAVLDTNQVILPAGTYRFEAFCPGYRCDAHRARIRDVTNGVTLGDGQNAHSGAADTCPTIAVVTCERTLLESTAIEVQHQGATTANNTGFGLPATFGDDEIYTILNVYKVEAG